MKKVLSYAFLVSYALLAVGLEINLHFCSDQLRDIALWNEASCCHHDHEGSDHQHEHQPCTEIESSCCSNESLDFSIEEFHVGTKNLNLDFPAETRLAIVLPSVANFANVDGTLAHASRAGPPLIHKVKRPILFHQLITYG